MKSFLEEDKGLLSCMFDTMAADGLATQGARASSSMVLALFSQNILVSAPEGLTHCGLVVSIISGIYGDNFLSILCHGFRISQADISFLFEFDKTNFAIHIWSIFIPTFSLLNGDHGLTLVVLCSYVTIQMGQTTKVPRILTVLPWHCIISLTSSYSQLIWIAA